MNFWTILIINTIFLSIATVGIAIKMLLKKSGEFKKQCSVKDPNTGKTVGCTCGGEGNSCHNA